MHTPCHLRSIIIIMWCQDSQIEPDLLKGKYSFMVRFQCGVCMHTNVMHFVGFYLGYFTNRPDHVFEDGFFCQQNDCSTPYVIEFVYSRNIFCFNIKFFGEFENEDQEDNAFTPKIRKNSIYYSLNPGDADLEVEDFYLDLESLESLLGNDSYANYISSVNEIRDLLSVKHISEERTLLKFFYSNLISLFETYLFDLIINAVNSDPETLRRMIEKYKLFDREKIEISDIFIKMDGLKEAVIQKLQSLIYHNLRVIIPLYKYSLLIDFTDLVKNLPEIIEIRHDIVHRNGKDLSGNEHNITIERVLEVVSLTNEIVDFINYEFERKGIKIQKPDKRSSGVDFPF